jgi:hypothetical protein
MKDSMVVLMEVLGVTIQQHFNLVVEEVLVRRETLMVLVMVGMASHLQ